MPKVLEKLMADKQLAERKTALSRKRKFNAGALEIKV